MNFVVIFILLAISNPGYSITDGKADADRYQLTFQARALAANAGGQEAYKLEWYHDHHAFYGFKNQALIVGNYSLMGAGYNYRLPICDSSCFWQFFAQVGGGVSNAGLYEDITWGSIIPMLPIWLPFSAPRYIPAFRIDITSQFFPNRQRLITWSYPLWVGITFTF
jgi:hypothetical protein